MLVKFMDRTGAEGDPEAIFALNYLLGNKVNQRGENGKIEKAPRAREPKLLSGDPNILRLACRAATAKHKYASGALCFECDDIDVLAFEDGDLKLRDLCAAIMEDFEETAFAGLPPEARPHVVWVAHTDKSEQPSGKHRLELNFIFARTARNAKGHYRAFNPKPPGKIGDDFWDAFRNVWNIRHGWADPDDPSRHKIQKLTETAMKKPLLNFDGQPEMDIRLQLSHDIYDAIDEGEITSRDDVIRFLEAQGYKLNRKGKNYISIKEAQSPKAKPIRLQGDLYNLDFTTLDWLKAREDQTYIPPRPRKGLAAAEEKLLRKRQARAAYMAERFGWSGADVGPIEPRKALVNEALLPKPDHDAAFCEWLADGPLQPEPEFNWRDFVENDLSPDLKEQIHYTDEPRRSLWLKDHSRLTDQGQRLQSQNTSKASLRLTIQQARAKGWNGLNMKAPEPLLRLAVQLCAQEGFPIIGRTPSQQRIIEDEQRKLAQSAPTQPSVDAVFETTGSSKPRPKATLRGGPQSMWKALYGAKSLAQSQLDHIADLFPDDRTVVILKDGSAVQDSDKKLHAYLRKNKEQALRMIFAMAEVKGWSGISVNGDEATLRLAVRIGIERNISVASRNPDQEAIILDEIKAMHAGEYDPLAGEVENLAGPTEPKPKKRSYKADPISKAWEENFGIGTLPDDLRQDIAKIEEQPARVTLSDGASFEDHDSRITSRATTEASFRLIIAAALAKGWTGLSIKGEEAFLRMATRIAHAEGIEIKGRDDNMQAIIEDELSTFSALQHNAHPNDDATPEHDHI